MATAQLVPILIIALISMVYLLRQEKNTPTPRKAEYLAAYPERVVNNVISCGCGSTKIFSTGTLSNFDTFIICKCKSCHKILYSTSANDKKPLETEVV
ncbi:MAG: hypothetical protein WCP20_04800 [Desulfuromonadales bacterium]